MPLHRIAVIGASSRIGPAILSALSATGRFETTILLRPSSLATAAPPPHTHLTTVPSDPPSPADLVAALSGHDALVCALHPSTLDLQLRLAEACVAAGVRRYVLADYGSVESDNAAAAELVPLFRNKTRVRECCERLAAESGGAFSWSSLVTGHFFDYGLAASLAASSASKSSSSLLGFDLRECRVSLFDGGTARWSCSSTGLVGRAVAGLLLREAETANKMLYVQSFCVTQRDVREVVERAMGVRLTAVEVDSRRYLEQKKREVDGGSYRALEDIAGVLGLLMANWEGKEGFANGLLGLEEEDMEAMVRSICGEIER